MSTTNHNRDKITVITVVYNGYDIIEKTILSVINQNYNNIEYLIIDGGSNDGTTDIIRKYSKNIHYWCSEPDKGVYDAMNKGIEKASGQWINFMNAGDFFFSENVVSDIFSSDNDFYKYALIYGDTEFRLDQFSYIVKAYDNSTTNEFMPFSHQASFVKSEVAKNTKFDLKYRIAADAAFCLRLLREGYAFKHIPIVVCSYEAQDGISVKNDIRRTKELVALQAELNGIDVKTPYFRKYIRSAYIRQFIKTITPSRLWNKKRIDNIKKMYKLNG